MNLPRRGGGFAAVDAAGLAAGPCQAAIIMNDQENNDFKDLDLEDIPVDDANDLRAQEQSVAAEAPSPAEAPRPAGAANPAEPPHPDEVTKLRAERDEYYQKLLRATADYRNSQRRLEQDKQQAVQYANSALIKALLPVIDNFERALSVDPEKTDVPRLLQGMQIVHDELLNVLKHQQVEAVAPAPGEPFNPELHQAMMQQPDERYAEPTVTMLLQKGYTHRGRVLRPAGVAVSRTE
jgi:molecular chaperone GrpE